MTNFDNNPSIFNCTFTANVAIGGGCCGCGGACADVARGGGLFDRGGETNQVVTNCIFWDNSDGGGADESAQIHLTSGTASVNFSLIQGWTGDLGGIGNIRDDPLFVDPDHGDVHISSHSPAIDVGDISAVEDGAVDMDGEPRVQHGVVDMGADEFNSCIADLDGDGEVRVPDLVMLLAAWGPCPEPPTPCPADIHGDGDGVVRVDDLALLLSNWGLCE